MKNKAVTPINTPAGDMLLCAILMTTDTPSTPPLTAIASLGTPTTSYGGPICKRGEGHLLKPKTALEALRAEVADRRKHRRHGNEKGSDVSPRGAQGTNFSGSSSAHRLGVQPWLDRKETCSHPYLCPGWGWGPAQDSLRPGGVRLGLSARAPPWETGFKPSRRGLFSKAELSRGPSASPFSPAAVRPPAQLQAGPGGRAGPQGDLLNNQSTMFSAKISLHRFFFFIGNSELEQADSPPLKAASP